MRSTIRRRWHGRRGGDAAARCRRGTYRTGAERVDDAEQRLGRPLDLDHLTSEGIDAAQDGGVVVEELILDFVDVVLQPCNNGGVLVDDLVHDAVKDGFWSEPQEIRLRFQTARNAREIGTLGVSDGDDEPAAGDHMQLTELDLLTPVDIAGGTKHGEQDCAVPLQFGPLVGGDGIIDDQMGQPQFGRN